ncbi:MAG TPA: hypothetical protein VMH05_13540 [Bryobacteraceae bacterium]|nr:hypothetical protein [Bryobacteraceae bacterium]
MQRLILAYKNFAANKNISHIGLGVAALNTCKVLRRENIAAEVWPVASPVELGERLKEQPASHVVVSAPWMPTLEMHRLVAAYPNTRLAVNCHSNVGFLQADANGVTLVREAMEIEAATPNFHLSGNSLKFCKWVRSAYSRPCAYLPNLYYLDNSFVPAPPLYNADGIAEGVPSVVSHAIDWVPEHWKAMMDNVLDIARVGRYLLTDPYAPQEGREALKEHNSDGIKAWKEFLSVNYSASN